MKMMNVDKDGGNYVVGLLGMVLIPLWLFLLAGVSKWVMNYPADMMRWWMWPVLMVLALLLSIAFFLAMVLEAEEPL